MKSEKKDRLQTKSKKARVPKRAAGKATKKSDERKVQFDFYAPDATEVFLAAEFNQWDTQSLPLKKNKQGVWKTNIKLPPGRYEYKLFMDGDWVQDIPGVERIANPFGTHNFIIWIK